MSANKNLINIKKTFLAVAFPAMLLGAVVVTSSTVSADVPPQTPNSAPSSSQSTDIPCQGDCVDFKPDPATQTSDLDCNGDGNTDTGCNFVTKYLNPAIRVLAGMAGIVIVISIIIGGIRYASSAGDPQAVNAAKTQIRNAIIALLCFFLLWSFLRFMFGGVL